MGINLLEEGDGMKIALDDKLVDYMHSHHRDIITVTLVNDVYNTYYIQQTKHPIIKYRKPRHAEEYDTYKVDDITVYVDKDIKTYHDELKFKDDKFLGMHRCHVEGIDISETNNLDIH